MKPFKSVIALLLLIIMTAGCALTANAQSDTATIKEYIVDSAKKTITEAGAEGEATPMFLPPPPADGCVINGSSSSLTPGIVYIYTLSCEQSSQAESWQVICGTAIYYDANEVHIEWDGGCTTGVVTAYNSSGSSLATKTVSIALPPLSGGTITNPSQAIPANTTPALIQATEASGGSCIIKTGYLYQWQISTNNITFTDIPDAYGRDYQPGPLSVTTYFRRETICGTVAYTNKATITVFPPLNGGAITSGDQTVNNTAPSMIAATNAFGGNCGGAYVYQWQKSLDNINFTDINGATTQNYQPPELLATCYFRRKVTCAGLTAYTGTTTITVIRPLFGGCITSGDQTIAAGNIPAQISATTASEGLCNGSYSYQWQSSTDNNYFTDIPGAASQNLSFSSSLTQTTYFQRKVICGSETNFTGSVKVTVTP